MATILILGGGTTGLTAGLLLARDGHTVDVLEADAGMPPDGPPAAWASWARDGVAQFRQPHFLQPRGRALYAQELPEVLGALEQARALRFTTLCTMPARITDRAPRPGDERLETLTARRPVLERAIAWVAAAQPGLTVRRGVRVTGVTAAPVRGGVPHVGGVATADGERLEADLVVDAMGRRSPLPAWLRKAGVVVPEHSEDVGFMYYSRFFRANGGGLPAFRAALNTPLGSITILTLPADADTWSVTVYGLAGDQAIKRLRHASCFDAVVAACPAHAHWLDGEPITDVLPMAGVLDRRRRLTEGGRPLVTGVALVGDAWACTNPSLGRGLTLGLLHALLLRDVARTGVEDRHAFARAWDESTERELGPWYADTVEQDRAAVRAMEAARAGWTLSAPGTVAAALRTAVSHDADAFRLLVANRACWTTMREGLSDRATAARIRQVARDHEPVQPPGPSRQRLLGLLAEPLAA